MKKMCLLIVSVFILSYVVAQENAVFENPVIRGDMADPSVIRVGDIYYATATSSEWAPFYPIFTSTDLINWKQAGHVFNKKPSWTSHSFWAPELYYHQGTMYCYYTARRKSDNTSYIGVATANGTSLKFTDHGPLIELGTEAIDAFVFDDEGQLFVSWKAYGLDRRPIELLGSRLSDDGLQLVGEPFTLLKDEERIGLEGQYHFKKGDYYYIIYSAKSCCGPSSDYDVRVARAKNFRGPYEKYSGNPILSGGNGDFLSCGHGTAVKVPDGRMFYLSHGYQSGDAFYMGRQPILHELIGTDDGWLAFKSGKHATIRQPLPFAGTAQLPLSDFSDDFSGKTLKVDWTWNYPYSDIRLSQKSGLLTLAGVVKAGVKQGTVLCLRPQSTHYSYETQIGNTNGSLKGLTLYGDDQNMIALGIQHNSLIVKSVKGGKETTLFRSETENVNPFLKIEVRDGCMLAFFHSPDGKSWSRVSNTPLKGSFLVRWDRVARPGLIHRGKPDEPAVFNYFKLNHLH